MPDGSAFTDLEAYIGIPQVSALALSPDGSRAVLTVATLSPDRTRLSSALWGVSTRGETDPVRLTRSAKGEAGVAFTPAGDILFVSGRPDADAKEDGPEAAQLWMLPGAGGEARALTRLAGGVSAVAAVADSSSQVIITAPLLRGAETLADDAEARAERRTRKLGAILHERYPVRYWDQDLGPGEPHLFALDLSDLADGPADPVQAAQAARSQAPDGPQTATTTEYPPELPLPRDLTPHPGRTLDQTGAALSPDGRTLITEQQTPRQRGSVVSLVAVDVVTGARRALFAEPDVDFELPAIDHSGQRVAFTRTPLSTPAGPAAQELFVAGLDGSEPRRLDPEWDLLAGELVFAADDAALYMAADADGRGPIFRVPLDGGRAEPLTRDDFSYSDLSVDRRDGHLVALRSSIAHPPHPVRIDLDGTVTALTSPVTTPAPDGRLTEIEAPAGDGTRIRAWLALPDGADAEHPAPLLLWVHGGPISSWNRWSWRWNPWLAVARGYAVLLPDPGLSTGYGTAFVARGWDAWGREPYTDLMSITDAAEAREDIDATHTAEMGASFGGYMSNWIAGHTDRFSAIVTHAGLWALDVFAGTTDRSDYWQSIFTAEGALANSPNRFVADIRTPMLVIHGDRDYRVPLGEGLALWSDLLAHHGRPDGSTDHRFLYFPDENHWILSPQKTILWWETVFAFLAVQVHGEDWRRPENLC